MLMDVKILAACVIAAACTQASAVTTKIKHDVAVGSIPRFVTVGDSVVDNITGLMWARSATAAGSHKAGGAITFCEDTQISGFCDWRLPSEEEILSIAEYCGERAKRNSTQGSPFKNISLGCYWLSNSACLNIQNGTISDSTPMNEFYVWPVRTYVPGLTVNNNKHTKTHTQVSSR